MIMNTSHLYTQKELPNLKDTLKRIKAHRDIALNLSLNEVLVRAAIALISPIFFYIFYRSLVLYIVPVITYLYLTAMMRYCVIKYLWRRYVKHLPIIKRKPYGKDINYPEESTNESMLIK